MSTTSLMSPRDAPHAPAPMPMRRVFGAYLAEARFETVRHLKTPAFALPFLIIPVALYLFFSTVAPGAFRNVSAGVTSIFVTRNSRGPKGAPLAIHASKVRCVSESRLIRRPPS